MKNLKNVIIAVLSLAVVILAIVSVNQHQQATQARAEVTNYQTGKKVINLKKGMKLQNKHVSVLYQENHDTGAGIDGRKNVYLVNVHANHHTMSNSTDTGKDMSRTTTLIGADK